MASLFSRLFQTQATPLAASRRRSGFALIAALALMGFLVLMLVSMSVLVRVEVGASQGETARMQARENALLGMKIALGQLQKFAGRDDRVTATGAILPNPESGTQHWTGVWQGGSNRNPQTQPEALTWLVSGNEGHSPGDSGYRTPENPGATAAQLIRFDDASGNEIADVAVNVPEVLLENNANQTVGAYAYWVGDEGVKANFAASDWPASQQAADPALDFYAQAAGQRYAIEKMGDTTATQALAHWPELMENHADLLAHMDKRVDLSLLPPTDPGDDFSLAARTLYHDITPHSFGLLTDTQSGGLKKDLSLAFEMPWPDFNQMPEFSGDDHWNLAQDGSPLHPEYQIDFLYKEPIPDHPLGGERYVYGPSWQLLRDFYRIYKSYDVNGGFLYARSMSPGWGENRRHYNQSTADSNKDHFTSNEPEWANFRLESMQIAPMVLRQLMEYRLTTRPKQVVKKDGTEETKDVLALVTNLAFVVHNPYNVPLRFESMRYNYNPRGKGNFLIKYHISPEGGPPPPDSAFKAASWGDIGKAYDWYKDNLTEGQVASQSLYQLNFRPALDAGGNEEDYVEMLPGEILVFSAESLEEAPQGELGGGGNADVPAFTVRPGYRDGAGFWVALPNEDVQTGEYDFAVIEDGEEARAFMESPDMGGSQQLSIYIAGGQRNPEELLRDADQDKSTVSQAVYTRLQSEAGDELTREMTEGLYSKVDLVVPSPLYLMRMEIRPFGDSVGAWPLMVAGDPRAGNLRQGHMIRHETEAPVQWRAAHDMDAIQTHLQTTDDGTTYWGESYQSTGGGAVDHVVLYSLPTEPMPGLASFQHADLFTYSNQPAYEIGNSHASPLIAPDEVYNADLSYFDGTFWDSSYLANEALWDSYFFSTLFERPERGLILEEVTTRFTAGEERLPNSRIATVQNGDSQLSGDILDASGTLENDAFRKSAAHLGIVGAFNVNSTSVEAWKALLSALDQIQPILRQGDGSLAQSSGAADNPFLRMEYPAGDESDNWAGYRELTDAQIESLASNIVNEVRARGPFLSLADFINRRLTDGSGDYPVEHAYMGPLQAAIEATAGLNNDARYAATDTSQVRSGALPYPYHLPEYSGTGLPGYLMQGDLLKAIGPILTARSDTFVIRAYGDSRNAETGEVQSRVWCEAVVQRLPEFVDQTNAPEPWTPIDDAGATALGLAPLSVENKQMGRAFVVRSFRWIAPDSL